MPRTFDGVDDFITLSLGAMGYAMGPGTVAAIIKRSADDTSDSPLQVGNDTVGWGLRLSNLNLLILRLDATNRPAPAGVDTCLAADGWLFVAASKETGTVAARFHRYEYATAAWQHADGVATTANSSTPGTSSSIGAGTGVSFHAGDIGVVGAWNVVLTDAQIESLAFSLPNWNTITPLGLWALHQSDVADDVLDSTGGGANESAITGTTVSASDIPGFSYTTPGARMMMGSGI